MKVYILQEDFGQYDDQYTTIHSVYDSPEKAEEAKKSIEDYHTNPVNPYPEMSLEEIRDYLQEFDIDNEKGQKLDAYLDRAMYSDFNFCRVIEKEVL